MSLLLNPYAFVAVPQELDCGGVRYDGSNDFVRYSSPPMTGQTDSKILVVSFWTLAGADGTRMQYMTQNDVTLNQNISVGRGTTSNRQQIHSLRVGASTPTVMQMNSDADDAILISKGWQHWIFSVDQNASGGFRQMYLDDAPHGIAVSANLDENCDLTATSKVTIGGFYDTNNKLNGDLAEFFMSSNGAAFDLTVEANRRKFISADGKPVDLGTDGSAPGLGVPEIYLSIRTGDAATDWATNRGQGENFTITGALVLSGTNPAV